MISEVSIDSESAGEMNQQTEVNPQKYQYTRKWEWNYLRVSQALDFIQFSRKNERKIAERVQQSGTGSLLPHLHPQNAEELPLSDLSSAVGCEHFAHCPLASEHQRKTNTR